MLVGGREDADRREGGRMLVGGREDIGRRNEGKFALHPFRRRQLATNQL